MSRPQTRDLPCPVCDHDHLWLPCDWCSCVANERPGIYPQE